MLHVGIFINFHAHKNLKSKISYFMIHPLNEYLVCTTYLNSKLKLIFSKMTFAHLSQATVESKRFYHRTQNTFNRIQNSFMSIEIHDQG